VRSQIGVREPARGRPGSLGVRAGATTAGKGAGDGALTEHTGQGRTVVLRRPGSAGDRTPHVRVVTVGGEIDALTAPELGALLTAQLAAASLMVVDLERVRFLGSAGLSVLFAANELATRENRYLWLVVPRRGMANRALEATGLDERFNVAETVAAALINSL
jgi:anti-sigma B factor antagonist